MPGFFFCGGLSGENFRQLGDVGGDAPGFVAGKQVPPGCFTAQQDRRL
jgi:hypothetical protein